MIMVIITIIIIIIITITLVGVNKLDRDNEAYGTLGEQHKRTHHADRQSVMSMQAPPTLTPFPTNTHTILHAPADERKLVVPKPEEEAIEVDERLEQVRGHDA
jgi:hypothetical protein